MARSADAVRLARPACFAWATGCQANALSSASGGVRVHDAQPVLDRRALDGLRVGLGLDRGRRRGRPDGRRLREEIAEVGQAVQNAANDPYLEQSGKSIGADIDVVEWTNFDNRSVGFRELSNLPNAGDRLLALNTVTSFSQ